MSRYIYNGTFKDGNGIVVESGTITVYLAGTSTLATIYTASSGGSADSDSAVASGTDGAFLFYVDENDYLHGQLFKITLSKTNFNSKSYDNIAIFPSETPNIVTKTTTYTAVLSDDIILCNGTFTLTLPAATTTTGKPFDIINIGTGTITISPNVDGASKTLTAQYTGTKIVSDGTNYYGKGFDGTMGGNYIYRVGGTDVALADGGTGASLTDPNADRIAFWDDTAGAITWLTVGTGLTITDTTMTSSVFSKFTALTATTDFSTTAASTSTITMATDQTANILVGYGIKFTLSSVVYYAQVTALTSTLMTIRGAPLTTGAGALTALSYSVLPSQVDVIDLSVDGYYEDATDSTLIFNDMRKRLVWLESKAYIVGWDMSQRTVDTGTEANVTVMVNAAAVGTANTNQGPTMSGTADTVVSTVIDISTSNYDINRGELLDVQVTKAGNGDAVDMTLLVTVVYP